MELSREQQKHLTGHLGDLVGTVTSLLLAERLQEEGNKKLSKSEWLKLCQEASENNVGLTPDKLHQLFSGTDTLTGARHAVITICEACAKALRRTQGVGSNESKESSP